MAPRARDWQRALYIPLTILAWLAVFVVVGWLLSHVVKTILTIVFAAIVAYALTPLVRLLSRRMPRILAIVLAYVLGFAVVIGLGALLVITVSSQITTFVHEVPRYAARVQQAIPHIARVLHPFGVTEANLRHAEQQLTAYLQSAGTRIASQSLDVVTGIVSAIIEIVLVLILSVYLTANGPRVAAGLRWLTPREQRAHASLLIAITNRVVGGYIRGTLTLAALIGILVGVGMFVLGVPYSALLGALAFFMEFIPIIGVLISGAVCVVIALFKGWVLALLVLGYFVGVHVIEGDLIGPRIMGRAVGIHPATALIALVAGTELFGIWGALFGAPLAGLIQAILTAVWREMRGDGAEEVLRAVEEEHAVAAVKPIPPIDHDSRS